MPTQVEITTWYLEMLDPAQFRPAYTDNPHLSVVRAEVPCPEFSRFLYTSVGGDWYWIDRLSWSYQQWLQYLSRPELETWVAYLSGTPAGYVELEAQPDGSVEIVYFGILKGFIGQHIGGHLLSHAIERGWAMGTQRVWVHTCSLDSPHARRNYEARGLRQYRQTTHLETIPDQPPGPWPDAYGGQSGPP